MFSRLTLRQFCEAVFDGKVKEDLCYRTLLIVATHSLFVLIDL